MTSLLMMLTILCFLLPQVLTAKECTYTSNLISVTDDSSIQDIKDDLRPIFLRLTSPGCPYSATSNNQWVKASQLYPQVDFVTVDCWKNSKICSLFGKSITTPYHSFIAQNSTTPIESSEFGNIEEISSSPQKFLDTIQSYSGLYPVSSPIINLFPVITDSFYKNINDPIFLLYNSKCSDEVPFLNSWTKIANEEIVPEGDYPRIGMLDCSKYFDECQRWIRPYAPQTPIALIYSSKTGNFEVLESYNKLSSDKIFGLYSNALSKPTRPMPTPIPDDYTKPTAPSDEGYTILQNTELTGRTLSDIKTKYVKSFVAPKSACATPEECNDKTLNTPDQCPNIQPSPEDHASSLKIINFFRELAGLQANVVEDSDWNDLCYSTAINMHKISKVPSDHVIQSNYATPAYCGKAENIQVAKDSLLAENSFSAFIATYKFFLDEGAHNDLEVGHRRWLLHPNLNKIGIGFYPYKLDNFGSYYMMRPAVTVIKVIDKGYPGYMADPVPSNLNFISWPSQGPFPIDHLPSNWHIIHPSFRSVILSDLKIYVSRDDGAELPIKKASLNNIAGSVALVIQMTPEALQLCKSMRTITVSVYNIIHKQLYRFSFELFDKKDLNEICLYSTDASKCPSIVSQENRFGPGNYQSQIFSSATGNVKVHVVDQIKLTQPLKITAGARFFIAGEGSLEGEIEIGQNTIVDFKDPSKVDFTTTWAVSKRQIGLIETAYKAKSIKISVIDQNDKISIHDLTFYTGRQTSCYLSSTLYRGNTNDVYYAIAGSSSKYYVSVSPVPAFQAYTTSFDSEFDDRPDVIKLDNIFDIFNQKTSKRIIKVYTSAIDSENPINLSCFIPGCKKDYQFLMYGNAYLKCDMNISKVANSIIFSKVDLYGSQNPNYQFTVYEHDVDDTRKICPMNFITINEATFRSTAFSIPYVLGDAAAKQAYQPSINFDLFPEKGTADSSKINAILSSGTKKSKCIITTSGTYDSYEISLSMDKKYNPVVVRPAEGTESKQVTITYNATDYDYAPIPESPNSFRTYFENYQDLILDLPTIQKGTRKSILPAYHFDNCTKVRFTKSDLAGNEPIEIGHDITLGNIEYGFTVSTPSVKVEDSQTYDASSIQTKELNVAGKTNPTISKMTIKEKINIESSTLILQNCQLQSQIELSMQKKESWPSVSLFETEFDPKSVSIDLGFSPLKSLEEGEEYESHSLIIGFDKSSNKCEEVKNMAVISNKGKFEVECSSDKTELVAVKGKENAPNLLPEGAITPVPTPDDEEKTNIFSCIEETCNVVTDGQSSNYTIRVNVDQLNTPTINIKPAEGTKSIPITFNFVDSHGIQKIIPTNKAKFVAHFENYDSVSVENPVIYEEYNLLDCYKFSKCGTVTFINDQPIDTNVQFNENFALDGSASNIDYGISVSYPTCSISVGGSYATHNIEAGKLSVDPNLVASVTSLTINKEIELLSSKLSLTSCNLAKDIKVSISKSTDEWPSIFLSNTPFNPREIEIDLRIIPSNNLHNLEDTEYVSKTLISGIPSDNNCDSLFSKITLKNAGDFKLKCADGSSSLVVEKGQKPDVPSDGDKPTDGEQQPSSDDKTTGAGDEPSGDDKNPGKDESKGGFPLGAIIGIAVGAVVVVVVIVIIVVVVILLKKRRSVYQKSSENEDELRQMQDVDKESQNQI